MSRFSKADVFVLTVLFVGVSYLAFPFSVFREAAGMVANNDDLVRKTAKILLFGSTTLLSIATIILLLLSRSRLGLVLLWVTLALLLLDVIYQTISDSYLSLDYLVMAISERGQAGNIFSHYAWDILVVTITVCSVGMLLTLARRITERRFSLSLACVCYAACLLQATTMIYLTGGLREKFLAPVRVPSTLAYLSIKGDRHGLGMPFTTRELDPTVTPHTEGPRNILFFVDESVTGTYLSVNGYPDPTTPFLDVLKDGFVNLGVASSVSNTSNMSNYILRNGIRLDDIPDTENTTLALPSLFSFAKRAGYQTLFIDAQLYDNARVQNYFSHKERANIDVYLTEVSGLTRAAKDFAMLDSVKSFLSKNEKSFVFFVKNGMHIPYFMQYPPDVQTFLPVFQGITEQNLGVVSEEKRAGIVNSYKNGITWTVDHFLETVLQEMDLEQTVVVYTSDHGQSLEDPAEHLTHGTIEHPPASQASVPLMVFGEDVEALFEGPVQTDCYSQFQIFPSLLGVMGYADDVTERYGMSFWKGPDPASRKFVSRSIWHPEPRINDLPGPTSCTGQ